jgi:DNA-binding MarR family transcriptional regulator
MQEEIFKSQLETAKQASVAQLLFKAARLWNSQAIEKIQAQTGGGAFRMAHTALLPHLDLDGTRITELSKRLGISKQATSQLVKEMEGMGLVEMQPDPDDRRARRVCFSSAGREALFQGLDLLQNMEKDLAQSFGKEDMQYLQHLLKRLLHLLEKQRPA